MWSIFRFIFVLSFLSGLAVGDSTLDYSFYLIDGSSVVIRGPTVTDNYDAVGLFSDSDDAVIFNPTNNKLTTADGSQVVFYGRTLPIFPRPLYFGKEKDVHNFAEFETVTETDREGNEALRLVTLTAERKTK